MSEQRDPFFAIIYIRLDTLKAAIERGDLDDAKFQYDRVLRSVQAAERQKFKVTLG